MTASNVSPIKIGNNFQFRMEASLLCVVSGISNIIAKPCKRQG
ncbi:hypothetical protein BMETH_87_0 [methanotrophic bacterial endosymbiont of Bathymodiolus sp.]|nr:hypothetical protein BMETH_87_0 [methanotrophic bacterial endosymbiont of Bathymodiolus sp.]